MKSGVFLDYKYNEEYLDKRQTGWGKFVNGRYKCANYQKEGYKPIWTYKPPYDSEKQYNKFTCRLEVDKYILLYYEVFDYEISEDETVTEE